MTVSEKIACVDGKDSNLSISRPELRITFLTLKLIVRSGNIKYLQNA